MKKKSAPKSAVPKSAATPEPDLPIPQLQDASAPVRVLLVDDDQMVRDAVARTLTLNGYTVLTASTGADALTLYRQYNPDITLLDIHLPDMNGFQVLRALRKHRHDAEIIFITGEGDMTLVIDALRSGVSDFVPKPLTMDILRTVLENAVRRRAQKTNLLLADAHTGASDAATPALSEKKSLEKTAPTKIEVKAFGTLVLTLGTRVVGETDWQSFKTLAVFKYLLIHHRKVVPIDELIDAVWQGAARRSAEVMVFTAVSAIRRLFEPKLTSGRASKVVITHESGYELRLGTLGKDYEYDVERFEAAVRDTQTNIQTGNLDKYREAVRLYTDEFLKNNRSDEWTAFARDRCKDAYLAALQALADDAVHHDRHGDTIELARKMLVADSLYEPAYSFLISAYLAQRRRAAAKQTLEQCEATFKKLLDAPAPAHLKALLA